MTLAEAIFLFGIMAALAALPSSSVALVVARAATSGPAGGVAVAIGIVLGDLLLVTFAMLGLSAVSATPGSFFVVVKIIGGLYLIWLGIKLLGSKAAPFQVSPEAGNSGSLAASFIAGFVLTLGDIKAILFYASLFPTFIDLTAMSAREIAVIVAITIVSVGGAKTAYAFLGARVARLAIYHKYTGICQKTAGALMLGAGSYLALKF